MKRLTPSLADYMVIGISPALIIGMVGSLNFYMIAVFCGGRFDARLTFIAGCFSVASVLIARIAMEEGRAYASFYSLALGGAVWLALKRFTTIPFPFDVGLLALIWWSADKLTWDCTLVSESNDPSSQGLLQTAGFGGPNERKPIESREAEPDPPGESAWKPGDGGLVAAAMNNPEAALQEATGKAKGWWKQLKRRPNKPGVWVIYFSLAAIPIFGIGQWWIPSEPATRRYTFVLLCVYLASGFGLLVTTSFLGLRHYLRRRNVDMPVEMAGVWLGAGAAKIAVLMLLISILTLVIWMVPATQVASIVEQFTLSVTSPDNLRANRHAMGSEGVKDKDKPPGPGENGERGGEKKSDQKGAGTEESKDENGSNAKGEKKDQQDSSGEKKGESDDSQKEPDGESSGAKGQEDQKNGGGSGEKEEGASSGQDEEKSKQDNSANQQKPQPSQQPSQFFSKMQSWFGFLAKFTFWIVVVCVVAVFAWYFQREIRDGWQLLVQKLKELWQLLFGRRRDAEATMPEAVEEVQPARPFSAFSDPFASGAIEKMSPDEIVQYSFEALEAWARERKCPRHPEQTPNEFALQVSATDSSITEGTRILASLYCQVAYAPGTLNPANVNHLRSLWQQLQAANMIGMGV